MTGLKSLAKSWRAAGLVLLIATVAAGCIASASSQSSVTDANRSAERIVVTGFLTKKGSDIESWFAITDDQGVIWRCVEVTPDFAAMLQSLQNQRVVATGAVREKLLFNRLRIDHIEAIR